MDNNTVTIEASQFSDFAKDNQDILEMTIGCIVNHSKYGQGKIIKIKKRDHYIPLIDLLFETDDRTLSFNSDSFKSETIKPINIPKQFYDLALQRKKEQERQTELAKQKEERNLKAEAIEKHKTRILNLGVEYNGFRNASKINNHRITHCYNCKRHLDNYTDMECSRCGYIICSCGACMCRRNAPL